MLIGADARSRKLLLHRCLQGLYLLDQPITLENGLLLLFVLCKKCPAHLFLAQQFSLQQIYGSFTLAYTLFALCKLLLKAGIYFFQLNRPALDLAHKLRKIGYSSSMRLQQCRPVGFVSRDAYPQSMDVLVAYCHQSRLGRLPLKQGRMLLLQGG